MMTSRRSNQAWSFVFAVLAASSSMAFAQQPPPSSLGFTALNAGVSAASDGIQELTIDWNAFAGPANQLLAQSAPRIPVNSFAVAERRVIKGSMPRERNPELSADQLVVVGTDANGAPLSWSIVKDPRIVRAEQPGADGVLTGQVLLRTSTQLLVVLPDSPQVTQVGIYQPRWTGADWMLDLVGFFAIGQAR